MERKPSAKDELSKEERDKGFKGNEEEQLQNNVDSEVGTTSRVEEERKEDYRTRNLEIEKERD